MRRATILLLAAIFVLTGTTQPAAGGQYAKDYASCFPGEHAVAHLEWRGHFRLYVHNDEGDAASRNVFHAGGYQTTDFRYPRITGAVTGVVTANQWTGPYADIRAFWVYCQT